MSRQLNRRTLLGTAAAAGAVWTFPSSSARALANDEIRIGFVSCGGRAGEHMRVMSETTGVAVASRYPNTRWCASIREEPSVSQSQNLC